MTTSAGRVTGLVEDPLGAMEGRVVATDAPVEHGSSGSALLDATGEVPWWPPERREPTLHRVLIHMIAETERHAGHADVVRELIDGSVGIRAEHSNLPDVDAAWWLTYRDRVERAAKDAGAR